MLDRVTSAESTYLCCLRLIKKVWDLANTNDSDWPEVRNVSEAQFRLDVPVILFRLNELSHLFLSAEALVISVIVRSKFL